MIMSSGINLKQLDPQRMTRRMYAQGVEQNFFRLLIAPIGYVDIGLGNSIDFAHVDLTDRWHEVRVEHTMRGINLPATRLTDNGGRYRWLYRVGSKFITRYAGTAISTPKQHEYEQTYGCACTDDRVELS